MREYISIDIGGTAIKYGIIDENACIRERKERKTEADQGGPSVLAKVIAIVEELKKRQEDVGNEISGICISTAGMVDIEKGEIFFASSLIPDYTGICYKNTLENIFACPCEVENDVNCAGLAECESGAARGRKNVLMLTVGTGIGGCVMLDGKVLHGCVGSAGEVGYMHLGDSDFQTMGSASSLTRKVAAWKQEPEELWDGYHIFEEAKKGDMHCNKAIEEMCDALGKGIANICYVLNPEIVVLGGGIMAQKEFLQHRIQDALDQYLAREIAKHTQIAFAEYGNDAGMLGAYYHFKARQRR
ncbi:MAG: ROK family protein [Clostridiales bacterium]|nr:ROK family protein [Clostridiales bacterium]